MKAILCWFFLSCKRYLRKVSFLFILLVLPVATYLIRGLEQKEGQEVRIAVCAESEESGKTVNRQIPLEVQLRDSLVQKENNSGRVLFQFYECRDEEQVKDEVASRRAECGYVIPRGLRDKLNNQDYRRCIKVYSAPSTVLASLSTEIVFATLAKLYDKEIFVDYVTQTEVLAAADKEQLAELAGGLYDKWMGNGSTFWFEYHYRGIRGGFLEEDNQNFPIFPVRGIVAVYLFLTGLYSAVMLGIDEKKELFLPLSRSRRWLCRTAVLGAPVFLAALSGLGALKTGGCFQHFEKELVVMGIYCLGICLFSFAVKEIFRKPQAVCCMIPLFLVGSLVFTPVFVDIRQFFPEWGWIEKLFLPSYYLRVF